MTDREAPSAAGRPPGRTGLRRRIFAWVHARGVPEYDRLVAARKRALFRTLAGDVLEIGAGSGANLPYLPDGVNLIALEPNLHMHPYLEQAARQSGRPVEIRVGTIETLDLPPESLDGVVSTLTLCSVDDLEQALAVVLRVLKSGGRFVFLEHVAAPPHTWQRRFQDWLQPVWSFVADGCHPNRETDQAIQRAGFARVELERFYLPLGLASPHIAGVAVKGP